jgi:hypothetical protein
LTNFTMSFSSFPGMLPKPTLPVSGRVTTRIQGGFRRF